jgi:hypothetical protein
LLIFEKYLFKGINYWLLLKKKEVAKKQHKNHYKK